VPGWMARKATTQAVCESVVSKELNPDPMACVDAGGAIRLTNGAFRRMFEADEPGAPPRLQRFLPWLGATTLHHILTTDDSKICDQPRDPLVMEGRIAGQRALIRVQIQRLSAFDTGRL